MARIGGKGMTRERDRIQENANKYVVKNCPAYRAGMNLPHYCKAVGCCINTYVDGMDCTTVTDCVVKRVIEKCTNAINTTFSNECFELAKEVTNLFDIEEVK